MGICKVIFAGLPFVSVINAHGLEYPCLRKDAYFMFSSERVTPIQVFLKKWQLESLAISSSSLSLISYNCIFIVIRLPSDH